MNEIQLNFLKNFIPPENDFSSFNFMIDTIFNTLTLGVYHLQNSYNHQYKINFLEEEQTSLLERYAELDNAWKALEDRLNEMISQYAIIDKDNTQNDLISTIDGFESNITEITENKDELKRESGYISATLPSKRSQNFQTVAYKIVLFVGHVFCCLCTLGIYSSYQEYHLRNRCRFLLEIRTHLKKKTNELWDRYQNSIDTKLELLTKTLHTQKKWLTLSKSPQGQHAAKLLDFQENYRLLQKENEDLKKELESLKNTYNILQTQHKTKKQGEKNFGSDDEMQSLYLVNTDLNETIEMQKIQIDSLQVTIQDLLKRCEQMLELEQTLPPPVPKASEISQLESRMGSIVPKYIPTSEEIGLLKGAEGVSDVSETAKDSWSEYALLFNSLNTAAEVFKRGFSNSLKLIFEMVDKGQIQLTRSIGTPTSKGAQVVYRHLALELIKGGQPIANCHGYHELVLNNKQVYMVPSQPQHVLQSRTEEGVRKFFIGLHFQNRDDFTPGESELSVTSAARGIDPIAAKCLYETLSIKARLALASLLMKPAVSNDNPNDVANSNWIDKQAPATKETLNILYDLISDIAVALEIKFNKSIGLQLWRPYLDVDNDDLHPFVREDDTISFSPTAPKADTIVPWKLDDKVFSLDKGIETEKLKFSKLVHQIKERYQLYFRKLKDSKLILKPEKVGKEIPRVTWAMLEKQYYSRHELIDKQGCLFSNLWAIFAPDRLSLDKDHILQLKKAMADYLDDPAHAEQFQDTLEKDHECSVKDYQKWLRQEPGCISIQVAHLTPVHIDIAAHTLGVRIALFIPPTSSQSWESTSCQVDKYGRIVPTEEGNIVNHYFGPMTEEIFFMVLRNNFSYHALFPIMPSLETSSTSISKEDLNILTTMRDYWMKDNDDDEDSDEDDEDNDGDYLDNLEVNLMVINAYRNIVNHPILPPREDDSYLSQSDED